MTHRADLERDTASGADAWGNAPIPTFTALATVKCFTWSRTRRERIDEDKTVVIEDMRTIMPLGTDVTEKDRIASIKDRAGTTIFSGPLGIAAVQKHRTHLELTLDRIE
ncbi:hypothetical protein MYX75_01030 [Acidobacteria bacterium AH-259-A15]|nr:hypothetical protein [Acidobacteria bacterium AH-259-A15]